MLLEQTKSVDSLILLQWVHMRTIHEDLLKLFFVSKVLWSLNADKDILLWEPLLEISGENNAHPSTTMDCMIRSFRQL